MQYPEMFFLPVLMLADYYLTIAGAVLRDKKYSQHFKTDHYELNPVWQKQVARKKWFSLRHTLLVVIITLVNYLLLEHWPLSMTHGFREEVFTGYLTCLFTFFGMIIGRHLSNILYFMRLNKNPHEISGQVLMSHASSLYLSLYQCLFILIPLTILVITNANAHTVGASLGAVLLIVIHLQWISVHRKNSSYNGQQS